MSQEEKQEVLNLPVPATTAAPHLAALDKKDIAAHWVAAKGGDKWKTYTAWAPPKNTYLDEVDVPDVYSDGWRSMHDILTFRRQGRTRTEKRFIREFILPLGDMKIDGYGNIYKRIGTAPVMWACHTDSVHRAGGLQRVGYGTKHGIFYLPDNETSNCLGADDGAGIWVMIEMALSGVEGLYVFHRDEESGGGGSTHFCKYHKEDIADIKMCVSLDRYGYGSVITHQGGRCCSDEFGDAFAGALNAQHQMFDFKRDSGGLFTDSANYTEDIPECTNLSVGYFGHHNSHEEVSLPHLIRLKNALCEIDMTKLPIKRDPKDWRADYGDYSYYGRGKGYQKWWGDKAAEYSGYGSNSGDVGGHGRKTFTDADIDDMVYRARCHDTRTMIGLVKEYPEEVADLLETYGIDVKNLCDELRERGVTDL